MYATLLLVAVLGAQGSATEALKSRDAEIRAALPPAGAQVTPAARKRIEGILTKAVDVRAMVEASMGNRWAQLPESQRRRLVAAFESRFRKTSGGELDTYRSTEIQYSPEVPAGAGMVKVPTRVAVKGEPTEIAYTMRGDRNAWRIVDIMIDGVSTVGNYRSSFARIISKDGVEGLIHRLERGGTPQKSEKPGKP